jgi:hypothetical protein
MAIHSVVWFVDGREGTDLLPIALKPNGTKRVEVIFRTNGEPHLSKESLEWGKRLCAPRIRFFQFPDGRLVRSR